MIEFIDGPSMYWRCPRCSSLLKKGMAGVLGNSTVMVGTATCGRCGAQFPQGDIHEGKYDLPEVRLNCPHCAVSLQGPAEELLGKDCPRCHKTLPEAKIQTKQRGTPWWKFWTSRETTTLVEGSAVVRTPKTTETSRDHEQRLEREGTSLPGEDDELARRLVDLVQRYDSLYGDDRAAADAIQLDIRHIGERLCTNGGDARMKRIAHRVATLGAGKRVGIRDLELHWDGICGWMY